MSMSRTNSQEILTGVGSSGLRDNNYFNNLEMREHLFDKVLARSDVQNLSRILIPKQDAVDHFPLVHNQAGMMLDFIDRNGKIWRFKYVCWKSSGKYMLSGGWKPFVEEKNLSAGDIVSFYSGYIPDENRPERLKKIMYIDWRRRSEPLVCDSIPAFPAARVHPSTSLQPLARKKLRLFGVDIEVSSSGETRGEMGVTGCTSSSPPVMRDDGQLSRRSPSGEMGASSSK